MAITTKPKTKASPASVDEFISGAPDSAPSTADSIQDPSGAIASKGKKGKKADSIQGPRGTIAMKGQKAQITLTISPELLKHLDARAETLGMTRTGLIVYAVNSFLGR